MPWTEVPGTMQRDVYNSCPRNRTEIKRYLYHQNLQEKLNLRYTCNISRSPRSEIHNFYGGVNMQFPKTPSVGGVLCQRAKYTGSGSQGLITIQSHKDEARGEPGTHSHSCLDSDTYGCG